MMFSKIKHAIQPYWHQIYQHPFNRALYDGTLPMHSFCNFVQQDKVYLFAFSKGLNYLGKQAISPIHREILQHLALRIEKTHERLHDKYLSTPVQLKFFSNRNPFAYSTNEAFITYIRYIDPTTQVIMPLSVALSKFLACYLIYSTVGSHMQQQGVAYDNLYRLWIESYSHPDYLRDTQLIIQVLNEVAAQESKTVDPKYIVQSFMKSVFFEIGLWNSVMPKPLVQDEPLCFNRPENRELIPTLASRSLSVKIAP